MTGSDKTHDAILWGGHGDVRARKADPKAAPNLSKPVCAELGCVVPLIVVPGEWSEAELDRKARKLPPYPTPIPNAPTPQFPKNGPLDQCTFVRNNQMPLCPNAPMPQCGARPQGARARCRNAPLYTECPSAPMPQWTNGPMRHCTNTPLCAMAEWPNAPMPRCIPNAPTPQCPNAPMHLRTLTLTLSPRPHPSPTPSPSPSPSPNPHQGARARRVQGAQRRLQLPEHAGGLG